MFIHRTLLCLGAAAVVLATSAVDAGVTSDTSFEVYFLNGHASESKALYQGRYDVAIERLESHLTTESSCSEMQLANLCSALVASGQLDRARDVCNQAIQDQSNLSGLAYNSLGIIDALDGDYASAIGNFEKAADMSNYPYPRAHFSDSPESHHRFGKDELDKALGIAERNKFVALARQAMTEDVVAEDLTAALR